MRVVSSPASIVLVLVALLVSAPSAWAHGGEPHGHDGAEHTQPAVKVIEPAAENAAVGTRDAMPAVVATPPSVDAASQAPQSVSPVEPASQSSAASRIAMIVAGAFAGLAALILLLGAVRRRTRRAQAVYQTPGQASHEAWQPVQSHNVWPAEGANAWPEQTAAHSRAAAAHPPR